MSSRHGNRSGAQPQLQTVAARLHATIEWLRDRWGWIVTVASFILYFITIGVLYCYGLLFISLQEDFNSSATIIGWIGSLAWAFSTLTSPLTNLLLKCCQTRSVALLGIFFCSSSLLISSFAPNVYMLFASFSLMYGMGINFTQHSTLCLIYTYFPKRNSTRTISFALTGCQVGLLALNPLMAFFVATKGWRLALRIFSSIVFIPGVISCIILLPPRKKPSDSSTGSSETGEKLARYQICETSESNSKKNDEAMSSDRFSPVSSEGYQLLDVKQEGQGDVVPPSSHHTAVCRYCLKAGEGGEDYPWHGAEEEKEENQGDMERTSVDTSMCRNPVTYFFSIALATLSLAWTFFNVNLVSYTDSVGIAANHGSILLTILAAGEMLGKALLCIFGDHMPFSKVYTIIACNVLSALISCVMIFTKDFYSMISVAVGIGLMRAIFNTVPFGAGIEIFGTSRTSEASTLAMFSYGSGYLVGSVIPGSIYDITGSYMLSLVCMTSIFMLSAVMFLIIPLRQQLHRFLLKGCAFICDPGKEVATPTKKGMEMCHSCGSVINIHMAQL